MIQYKVEMWDILEKESWHATTPIRAPIADSGILDDVFRVSHDLRGWMKFKISERF